MNAASLDPRLLSDYAWSAWASLGVPGWDRGTFAACVDVEALILFTATIDGLDPRLRQEALSWCVSNIDLISRSRIGGLLRNEGASQDGRWQGFASTLSALTKRPWPQAAGPAERIEVRPVGVRADDPQALALRTRGLMGATSRSEIVRALLLNEPGARVGMRELLEETGFTRKSASDALGGLELAGVVRSSRVGNAARFELRGRASLDDLLGPLPRVRESQRLLLRVTCALLRAAQDLQNASERVAHVESVRVASEIEKVIQAARPGRAADTDSLESIVTWCRGGLERALEPGD
ncbi:hypothetical protein [Engelhardtia mirabilis]